MPMTAWKTSEPPCMYTRNCGVWNKDMKTIRETPTKGKRIAITGILAFYKRRDAFELIRNYGGIPQENVTRETDYLVVGYYKKNTLKREKSNKWLLAERYIGQGRKITIIKEDEFLRMVSFRELSP